MHSHKRGYSNETDDQKWTKKLKGRADFLGNFSRLKISGALLYLVLICFLCLFQLKYFKYILKDTLRHIKISKSLSKNGFELGNAELEVVRVSVDKSSGSDFHTEKGEAK